MNALAQRIAALIAAEGPLPLAQFMSLALLDPANGYYATRDPFGRGGDFTTAPEISQIFGEMLGLWCVQVWHDQGKPAKVRLVELGPGRGTLMADALRAAQVAPEFCAALDVVLVEASPALQAAQREMLKDAGVAVRWTAQFGAALTDRPLFLLANEFFDALPVSQFVKTPRGWCERMVTLDAQGELAFALAPISVPDASIPASRDGAPDGGVYEVSPAATALAEEIAHAIAAKGGGALIVDYGYGMPGFGETLQAVADHAYASILGDPGENDLSAHVDFTALGAAARRGGAAAYGPTDQGEFLMDLGFGARTDYLINRNRDQSTALADAMKRLVDPAQMGTLFKALAIMPAGAPNPPGF